MSQPLDSLNSSSHLTQLHVAFVFTIHECLETRSLNQDIYKIENYAVSANSGILHRPCVAGQLQTNNIITVASWLERF